MRAILTLLPQSLRNFFPALAQEHGPLNQLRSLPFQPACSLRRDLRGKRIGVTLWLSVSNSAGTDEAPRHVLVLSMERRGPALPGVRGGVVQVPASVFHLRQTDGHVLDVNSASPHSERWSLEVR